jgi:hypothetical protein
LEVRIADELRRYLFDRWYDEELKPREGIHLSDLDMCLGKSFYKKMDEAEGRLILPSESLMLRFMLGWSLQHEILGVPEEYMEVDGIQMSVDAPINGKFIEFKTTKLNSAKFDVNEHPSWLMRTKGYCRFRGITSCYIVVCFLNGDYGRTTRNMQLIAYEITYTPEELEENWAEVLRRRDLLLHALETGKYPSPDFHEEWACKECEHNIPGRCHEVRAK